MKALVLALAMVLPWFGFTPDPVCRQPHRPICSSGFHRDPVGHRGTINVGGLR